MVYILTVNAVVSQARQRIQKYTALTIFYYSSLHTCSVEEKENRFKTSEKHEEDVEVISLE